MNESDKIVKLVNDAVRGKAEALNSMVQCYGPSVFRVIVTMVGNAQDAEELTQDVLLKGIRQLRSYDPARATLKTWLCSMAYREALNHLRRPALQVLSFDDDDVGAEAEAELQRLLQQPDEGRTELLRRAIALLSNDEQTLVTLFYYDELPLADVAYVVGQSAGSVAVRLHRIRKKLYHLIKQIPAL